LNLAQKVESEFVGATIIQSDFGSPGSMPSNLVTFHQGVLFYVKNTGLDNFRAHGSTSRARSLFFSLDDV